MKIQDFDALVETDRHLCHLARKELKETWFLTRSVWPSVFFVSTYLLFVKLIGPRLMRNREAFSLKPIILTYNLIQCLTNAYMWSRLFQEGHLRYILENMCHAADHIESRRCQLDVFLIWLYHLTKVTDLLDTVFFILKKKESQVTFLHIFHHAVMVPVSQYIGINLTGTQIAIAGGINTIVHTIMYGYYFLSALGPRVQKYLWWKIYVTRLQMIQFILVIAYLAYLVVNKCPLPDWISYFLITIESSFLILFLNFYIRSYVQKKRKLDDKSEKDATQNTIESTNKKES